MIERPILFSAPMVRAILAGKKTQTRRLIAKANGAELVRMQDGYSDGVRPVFEIEEDVFSARSPYGVPGDRLWVRETWAWLTGNGRRCVYRADGHPVTSGGTEPISGMKWTPSIYMRRSESRIALEVTDVRVERLQDISEEDARAEGAQRFAEIPTDNPYGNEPRWSMESPTHTNQCLGSARMAFGNFINKLNGPLTWASNPWVWVVEFRKIPTAGAP